MLLLTSELLLKKLILLKKTFDKTRILCYNIEVISLI